MSARRGAVLIVVAGIAAILAALALAFLGRMREDAIDAQRFMREVQARTMLTAALMYVAETGRLGWDRPPYPGAPPSAPDPEHEEAFGWIDVRDGGVGPRDRVGRPLHDPLSRDWPAVDASRGGAPARCPMDPMRVPPWAIRLTAAYDPIPLEPNRSWADLIRYNTEPEGGELKGDPRPVASTWTDFAHGDTRPIVRSSGLAWFRARRIGISTFHLVCGAGATRGWRDFAEADAGGEGEVFGSRAAFDALRADETVLHFACEWTPSSGYAAGYTHHLHQYTLHELGDPTVHNQNSRQFVGTFLWIQKLEGAAIPAQW
ncbi:MAG TPA: hypothetical protein VEL07_18670 [Planctomycetota bacterium]|nr:hypothetical protein [Planctomycetota bacterium]